MESIIHFFRDILDGPLYIVVVIVSVILIFALLGYLMEKSQNRKKQYKEQNDNSEKNEVVIDNNINQVQNSIYSDKLDNTDSSVNSSSETL